MTDKEPTTPRDQPTKYPGKMYNGVPGAPIKKVGQGDKLKVIKLDKEIKE